MNKKIGGIVVLCLVLLFMLFGCIGSCGGSSNKTPIGRCVVCGNPTSLKQGGYYVCSSCKKRSKKGLIPLNDNFVIEYIME